jgi:hypothetical protein
MDRKAGEEAGEDCGCAMKETNVMRLVMIRASELGARLMRNNVAKAWVGEARVMGNDTVLITNARRLHAGLGIGTSDLIGWMPVKITPEMVGSTVAVFVGAEVKAAKGRATDEQKDFISTVHNSGGIAGVVRSESDIERLLNRSAV